MTDDEVLYNLADTFIRQTSMDESKERSKSGSKTIKRRRIKRKDQIIWKSIDLNIPGFNCR